MSGCTINTVLGALTDGAKARSALSSLRDAIWSFAYPDPPAEFLIFGSEPVSWEEEPLGIGSSDKIETYVIPCVLVAGVAGEEADDTANGARSRALTFVADIEAWLMDSPTLGGTCLGAEFKSGTISLGIYEGTWNGIVCEVKFSVTVEATKTP